jgi:hypothetical protein
MRSAQEIASLVQRILTRSNDRALSAYERGDLTPPEFLLGARGNAAEIASQCDFSQPLRRADASRLLRVARACSAYPLELEALADPVYVEALRVVATHASPDELAFLWQAFTLSLKVAEQPTMWPFERELLPEHWSEVANGLSQQELEDGQVIWRFCAGVLRAAQSEGAGDHELSERATKWCSDLINAGVFPPKDSMKSEWPLLLENQLAGLKDLVELPVVIHRFARHFQHSFSASVSYDADIIRALLDEITAKQLLEALADESRDSTNVLATLHKHHIRLLDRMAELCPKAVASLVSSLWLAGNEWHSERKRASAILTDYGLRIGSYMKVPLGYEVGMTLFEDGLRASTESVEKILGLMGIQGDRSALSADLVPEADLWLLLRKAAGYKSYRHENETELAGIRPNVVQIASAHPEIWNEALPWLLARSHHLDGLIEAVTIEQARQNPTTVDALRRAMLHRSASVRDRASGVLAMFEHTFDTTCSLESVVDFIARYTDGSPIFPHPLTPTSRIWLGSRNVEQMLLTRIEQAVRRFSTRAIAQGRAEEEGLTRTLITELEVAFRNTDVATTAVAKSKSGQSPGHVSLNERPVPKAEENTYGCDLALLVSGEVHGRIKFQSCELVQVKKSMIFYTGRESKGLDDNKWKIEIPQLRDHLLAHSQTAVYWLVTAQGDVLVVPARMLLAIIRGMGREGQGTVDLGYSRIRSMAIPLNQFLVDLLLGGWIGSEDAGALSFARGEHFNTKPLHIVEIKVRYVLD